MIQPNRPDERERARRRSALDARPDVLLTRREAAEALGVSIDTIDRRVRSSLPEHRTAWGAIGIPGAEVHRLLAEPWPLRGRPRQVDAAVVERIVRERSQGRSLRAIAHDLSADGVAPAQGGRCWYASTVKYVLDRTAT